MKILPFKEIKISIDEYRADIANAKKRGKEEGLREGVVSFFKALMLTRSGAEYSKKQIVRKYAGMFTDEELDLLEELCGTISK